MFGTLLVLLLHGCNILVPALYVIEGPGEIDAQHVLSSVPTVVFVDDRNSIMPRTALRVAIGNKIGEDLVAEGMLLETISTRDAIGYARKSESGSKTAVD